MRANSYWRAKLKVSTTVGLQTDDRKFIFLLAAKGPYEIFGIFSFLDYHCLASYYRWQGLVIFLKIELEKCSLFGFVLFLGL